MLKNESSNFSLDFANREFQVYLFAIFMFLVIFTSSAGNLLVLKVVLTDRRLRISHNYCLVSLAVADVSLGVFIMPISAYQIVFGEWPLGFLICKIWLRLDIFFCTASILNLCAITFDRYWAVTNPIKYFQNQKQMLNRVIGMIIAVWVASASIAAPTFFGWKDWHDEEEFNKKLVCSLIAQREYTVFSALSSFYIPSVIIVIVGRKIILAMRCNERRKASRINMQVRQSNAPNQQAVVESNEQADPSPDQDSVSSESNHSERSQGEVVHKGKNKEKKRRNMKKLKSTPVLKKKKYLAPKLSQNDSNTVNESASGSKHNTSCSNVDDKRPTQDCVNATQTAVAAVATLRPVVVDRNIRAKQRIFQSKERKAVRTLAIVMVVFIACWTPFFVYYLITAFCPSCNLSPGWVQFLTWLGYSNSAFNPFIYTMFNKDFRRSFKKLLLRRR